MSTIVDRFTEIVDVTLYKYNSIDLKLWGIIVRNYTNKIGQENNRIVSKDKKKMAPAANQSE